MHSLITSQHHVSRQLEQSMLDDMIEHSPPGPPEDDEALRLPELLPEPPAPDPLELELGPGALAAPPKPPSAPAAPPAAGAPAAPPSAAAVSAGSGPSKEHPTAKATRMMAVGFHAK
jgi:hypothetical protein